jgi:hypothetical protein
MTASVSLSIGLTEPIGDWRSLVNAVRNWLNRDESDLSDTQVSEFIALAEAEFNRVLRVPEMDEVSVATIGLGNVDLPSDFLAAQAVFFKTRELGQTTPIGLIRKYGDVLADPLQYCILDGSPRKIRLGPQPKEEIQLTLIYYKKIESVSENNPDNWLLNDHPDIYLWGALLCAEAYITNDDRVPGWEAKKDAALSQLIASGRRDRFGGGPLEPSGFPEIDCFDASLV